MKKLYTSIDIGSDSIKILVAEMYKDKLNVLAQTETRTKGMKKGLITDANEVLISLKESFQNIEGKLGIKIEKVIASIPPYFLEFETVDGYTTITNEESRVNGNDIVRTLQASVYNKVNENKELVSLTPIEFILDEKKQLNDPNGLVGKKLEVKARMVTTYKKNVQSILSILQMIGIEVVDINIGPIADYNEFRTKELDKTTTAIINIGAELTTISVFNKGILEKAQSIQIGGKNIDNDIAYVFKLDDKNSKKLKETFSLAHKKFAQVNETHEILNINRDLLSITQYDLSQVVMSRAVEIIEIAKKQTFLLTNQEIRYIIITGGTTELPGINYLINDILGNCAKIGEIDTIGIRNNKFSTVSGLIKTFDQKQKLKNRNYSTFGIDKEEELSLPKKKINISNDSVLGKVFGYFFDS